MRRFSLSLLLTLSFHAAQPWDSIPIISQVKSLVQVIGGDAEGARQTQENFSRSTLAVFRAPIEHAMGNHEEAQKTWKYYGKTMESYVDATPLLGHVKGGIHYAAGDRQRGDEIMKSATRPVGVIAGGIGGFVVGGPVGAAAGGIAGGAAMDGVLTGVESAINKEYVPNGIVSSVTNAVNGKMSVSDGFDMGMNIVGDGVAGYAAGKAFQQVRTNTGSGASKVNNIRCRRMNGGSCSSQPYKGGRGWIQGTGDPVPLPGMADKLLNNKRPVSSINGGASSPPRVSSIRQNPPSGGSSPSRASSISRSPSISSTVPLLDPVKNSFSSLAKPIAAASATIIVSSPTEPKTKDNDEDEDKKKETCESIPNIKNNDENQMANCRGSKAGQSCRVNCKRNFVPTKAEVKCVKKGQAADWETNGAHCVPTVDCRDHRNNVVDWFIAHKLNQNGPQDQEIPIEDYNYNEWLSIEDDNFLFMSSLTANNAYETENLATGSEFIQTLWEPLDNTLAPIQYYKDERLNTADDPQFEYFAYTDQPAPSHDFAHAKGVLASRNGQGYLLMHSQPKYPFLQAGRPSRTYAQIFMCVNLRGDAINLVKSHLATINAHVYDSHDRSGNFRAALGPAFPQYEPHIHQLRSRGGVNFDLFTKRPSNNVDIWRDMVSAHYRKPMYVAWWTKGVGEKLPSICEETSRHQILETIIEYRYQGHADRTYTRAIFRTSQNHAKWAVGKNEDDHFFCVGDMNRVGSQMARGGGALCIKEKPRVASTFRELVVETNCTRPRPG